MKGLRIASAEAVPGKKFGCTGAFLLELEVIEFEIGAAPAPLDTAVRWEEVVDSLELGRRVNVRSIVAVVPFEAGAVVEFKIGLVDDFERHPPAVVVGKGLLAFLLNFFGAEFFAEFFGTNIGPSGPQAMPFNKSLSCDELDFVGFRSKDSISVASVPPLWLSRRREPLSEMLSGLIVVV